MATIEIDGKTLNAESGQMLIEAAEAASIHIPRFCYHKKLSVAANCRMCLVEVENAPKPVPACATPISDGMVVKTRSPKALAAQKAVMEFLLINHPLDCPICDQGGECELQDVAMGYGGDVSAFSESKRVVDDQDIGPLIQTEMTRCIHCTRCVRFGEEIAGLRELGATGRGEHTRIGTFLEKSIQSPLSGNVIDLCPVGALTSKPFRFSARAWEMQTHAAIASHDCLGSNISAHTRRGEVMRVVPRENEAINEVWISDRDRFSYEAYQHEARATCPQVKENGTWKTVSWPEALKVAADKTLASLKAHGADKWGVLLHPNSTTEEAFLAQKIIRAKEGQHIDHRLREADTRYQGAAPLMPSLGTPFQKLESAETIILIGATLNEAQPILAHRLRKAAKAGAKIIILDEIKQDQIFEVHRYITPAAQQSFSECLKEALLTLDVPANGHVIVSSDLRLRSDFSVCWQIAKQFAKSKEMTFGELTEGANAAGAWLAGAVPHRKPGGQPVSTSGLTATQMLSPEQGLSCFWLMGFDPTVDVLHRTKAKQALQKAETVVVMTAFATPELYEIADVILPMALPLETPGTYVNAFGHWQTFVPAVDPVGQAKPGWKILRVLGNLLDVVDFDFMSTNDVRLALRATLDAANYEAQELTALPAQPMTGNGLRPYITVSPYHSDSLVRHAKALQATAAAQAAATVQVSRQDAERLGINTGDMVKVVSADHSFATMPCMVDEALPAGFVALSHGLGQVLPETHSMVELQPA